MSLQLGRAIGDGVHRGLTRSGAILAALVFVYQFLIIGATNTISAAFLPSDAAGELGVTFPVPVGGAVALLAASYLFSIVAFVVLTRALTRDFEELSTFPSTLYTRRIGRATLSAFVASIVVAVAVFVGLLLLVVPGLFFMVSFLFVLFVIGVEDARAVDSLKRSWALARGNRIKLFVLVLVVGVVIGTVGAIGSLGVLVSPVVGDLVSMFVTSVLAVLGYGIFADAFVQLRDDTAGDGNEGASIASPTAA